MRRNDVANTDTNRIMRKRKKSVLPSLGSELSRSASGGENNEVINRLAISGITSGQRSVVNRCAKLDRRKECRIEERFVSESKRARNVKTDAVCMRR